MDYVYYKKKDGEYEKLDIDLQFSQVYSRAIEMVGKIKSASALHLLFWVLGNMQEYNTIILRKHEKLKFISQCSTKYTISTVNKAIKSLIDAGVLISRNSEGERLGEYAVNPLHFWRLGSNAERKEFIASTLQLIKWKEEDEKNRNKN